ncbi:helix-turn-helix domain-containing protein [Saccharopolyspora phatthalungensis]|uniref:Transcriptional regulator with XRE-family HTH domain n=1 Tax=Saccharopolyspora phatthalungensis TaxID=664693 RepID=A0A840PYX9_9PSEU|nr:helix-turn-helix transcriptional regulator [Saccharopolyspora phatthalungensis]MBB5155492.1 transcriptional regulator with XRE-family HTH domain [Saccharopolyspora phatthalungensis]
MLRKQRIGSGLTAAELAKATGMSASKVSRFENCESGIYLDDLEKLLDFYRPSKKRRVELLDIARHADERGWLRLSNANLPEDWQTWTDFEYEASALLNYEPLVVPGLLQTPEYTRAIIDATGRLSAREVDSLVSARMARQGLLGKEEPLELHVIIEETALTRPIGPDGALERQLRHLADAASRPNITIQVMPHDAGLHPGLNGSFVILEYGSEASLVLLEHKTVNLFMDEDDQLAVYSAAWDELVGKAKEPGDSVKILQALIA